jgi:hypothetical protein
MWVDMLGKYSLDFDKPKHKELIFPKVDYKVDYNIDKMEQGFP